jgi:hypothetical protein
MARAGALHRQVRTERVPQDVHALLDPRDALSTADRFDHAIARDRRPIREAYHPVGSQMPSCFNAAVNRCVIGGCRDLPPLGTSAEPDRMIRRCVAANEQPRDVRRRESNRDL